MASAETTKQAQRDIRKIINRINENFDCPEECTRITEFISILTDYASLIYGICDGAGKPDPGNSLLEDVEYAMKKIEQEHEQLLGSVPKEVDENLPLGARRESMVKQLYEGAAFGVLQQIRRTLNSNKPPIDEYKLFIDHAKYFNDNYKFAILDSQTSVASKSREGTLVGLDSKPEKQVEVDLAGSRIFTQPYEDRQVTGLTLEEIQVILEEDRASFSRSQSSFSDHEYAVVEELKDVISDFDTTHEMGDKAVSVQSMDAAVNGEEHEDIGQNIYLEDEPMDEICEIVGDVIEDSGTCTPRGQEMTGADIIGSEQDLADVDDGSWSDAMEVEEEVGGMELAREDDELEGGEELLELEDVETCMSAPRSPSAAEAISSDSLHPDTIPSTSQLASSSSHAFLDPTGSEPNGYPDLPLLDIEEAQLQGTGHQLSPKKLLNRIGSFSERPTFDETLVSPSTQDDSLSITDATELLSSEGPLSLGQHSVSELQPTPPRFHNRGKHPHRSHRGQSQKFGQNRAWPATKSGRGGGANGSKRNKHDIFSRVEPCTNDSI